MSLTKIRPYFKAACEGLDFKEHEQAFSNHLISGKKFFIQIGETTQVKRDQISIDLSTPVLVELHLGKDQNTLRLEEAGLNSASGLISLVMSQAAQAQAKVRVQFDSMIVAPLDSSNDKSVVARVNFKAITTFGF